MLLKRNREASAIVAIVVVVAVSQATVAIVLVVAVGVVVAIYIIQYSIIARYTTWFPSSLLEIRVPLFLLFGFNKGAQKEKRAKGSYWAA